MLNARLHVCNNWLNSDHSFDAGAEHIAEFFEELGLYLRMKSVPQNVISETQSYYVKYYYDIFYNAILKMRKNLQDETLFSECKYLNEQMHRISEKKTALVSGRTDDEVRFFLEREIHIAQCLMHLKAVDVASSSLVAEGGCEVKIVIKGCSPELGSNAVVLQNSPRGQD